MNTTTQANHGIQGMYSSDCDKISYASEQLAAAQLRLLQARGRTERDYYRCPRCSTFHLTGRRPEDSYRLEANSSIEVDGTTIGVCRKVRADEITVRLMLSFATREGIKKNWIYSLPRSKAQAMLDGLIDALYGNGEDEGTR